MNSKFLHSKYLAILLMALVVMLLVTFEAFSATEMSMEGAAPIKQSVAESIMRPVTRYESYQSTCTRQVSNGSHRVCSSGPSERKCRKVAGVGVECWDESGAESCSYETSYETEHYSCTETRAYTDYVYDHTVYANFEITKNGAENFDLSKCSLLVDVSESGENYSARCAEAIVRLKVLDKQSVKTGNDIERSIKAELNFSSIAELNALKLGLNSLAYKKGLVTFSSADLSAASNFKLSAKLVRNRLLLKDKVLLNRSLNTSEFAVTTTEAGKAVTTINLAKLTGLDASKKHNLTVTLSTVKPVDVKGAINTPELKNQVSAAIVINQ